MDVEKKITLLSSDGQKCEISSKAVQKSVILKGLIEDYPDHVEFPVNNVKGNILKKIIDYLEYYKDKEPKQIEKPLPSTKFEECVDPWDFEYTNLELELLFELILGANYLDIKPLLELTTAKVAYLIQGKSTEGMREFFRIKNDFTPEEEQQIQEERKWCMESL